MHHRLAYLALLGLLAPVVKAECPPLEDVPVMHPEEEDTFNCARRYSLVGADHPVQGCNACQAEHEFDWDYDNYDGYKYNNPNGQIGIGSMIVLPGCTFYGFSQGDYLGTVYEYSAGTHSNVKGPICGSTNHNCGDDYACGFKSVKCRCQQKLISCVPEDGK